MLKRWITGGILILATAGNLAAEDPLPAITGVTVVVETNDKGFVMSGPAALSQNIRLNFYIFVSDLNQIFSSIASVKVKVGTLEWTVNKTAYSNLKAGYLGGEGRWSYGGSTADLIPIDLKAVITLDDGRKIEKPFRIVPVPASGTPGLAPLFLVTSAFQGKATPYHLVTPQPAQVQRAEFEGSDVVIDFTITDPRIRRGAVRLYASDGTTPGASPTFSADGPPLPWLNEGAGLFTDGRVNKARIGIALFHPKEGAPSIDSVGVTTWDAVDPESNLLRRDYLSYQNSTLYAFSSGGSEPLAAGAEYRAALKAHPAVVPSLAWDESSWRAWALRLGGILGVLNDESFLDLTPYRSTPANRDMIDAMLSSSWSIVDKASLLDNLQTLDTLGHRSRFARQLALIQANPGASDEDLAAQVAETEGWSPSALAFVRAFAPTLGDRGLLAWDLCRMIMLARDGRFLGYLTDDEAWSWIDRTANRLREAYDSWTDLGEGFLAGRMYFAGPTRASELYIQARGAMQTLLGPGGEWAKVPWPPRAAASIDFVPAGY